jgi:hypothetical protein
MVLIYADIEVSNGADDFFAEQGTLEKSKIRSMPVSFGRHSDGSHGCDYSSIETAVGGASRSPLCSSATLK